MIEFLSAPSGDRLDHYNEEFLAQREDIHVDLSFLKLAEISKASVIKTFSEITDLMGRLNPPGIQPTFMTVVASERPAVLSEVKDDMLPIWAASDRQGILWVRAVFLVNGQKVAQSGHDGSSDNIAPTSIMGPDVISFGYAFDGTDWDRIRTIADNSDALVTGNPGHIGVMNKNLGFNGTTYDRLRSGGNDSDNVTNLTTGVVQSAAYQYGFDGTTWDRIRSVQWNSNTLTGEATGALVTSSVVRLHDGSGKFNLLRGAGSNGDGVAVTGTNELGNVVALGRGFNGSTLDRLRTASATNQNTAATGTLTGIHLSTPPGNWSVNNFPATDTQATVTRAAGGAGVRHVLTMVHFSISGAAALATAILQCTVLDGATVIFSGVLSAVANDTNHITVSGLSIVGSENTAMTIQFSGAGGAGTQQSVTMSGYDVV